MHVYCTNTVIFTHLTELNSLIKKFDRHCHQAEQSGALQQDKENYLLSFYIRTPCQFSRMDSNLTNMNFLFQRTCVNSYNGL